MTRKMTRDDSSNTFRGNFPSSTSILSHYSTITLSKKSNGTTGTPNPPSSGRAGMIAVDPTENIGTARDENH